MSVADFNQILLSNADFLKPFAITLTRDSEAAKDLFQETMYKALANHEKYNTGTNIRAWLFIIMRNIFINNYRRNSKQKVVLDSTVNSYFLNTFRSVNNDGPGNISLREMYNELDKLPVSYKNSLLLYFQGYKYAEVAMMLNEPIGTIKSRIHFARKILKMQIIPYA